MSDLSVTQVLVLRALIESIEARGYPPTVRELGDLVGLSSTNTVVYQLRELETKGYIKRDPGRPRMITILKPPPGTKNPPETYRALDFMYAQIWDSQQGPFRRWQIHTGKAQAHLKSWSELTDGQQADFVFSTQAAVAAVFAEALRIGAVRV